jgi:dolichyl-phosphate-mannose--protein O-mannosyl transferase
MLFSDRQYRLVTAVENASDVSAEWTIMIQDLVADADDRIGRINVPILFIHGDDHGSNDGAVCALSTKGKPLPKWASGQVCPCSVTYLPFSMLQSEVSCNPNLEDPSNIWNIESHFNEHLESVTPERYEQSFWDAFWEVRTGHLDMLSKPHRESSIWSWHMSTTSCSQRREK